MNKEYDKKFHRQVRDYDNSWWQCAKHMLNNDIKENLLKIFGSISDEVLNRLIDILSEEKVYQEKVLEYRLSIHDDPKILSKEDTKKLDDIYEYVRNSGELLAKLSNPYINKNLSDIAITIDNKENKFSVEEFDRKVKKMIKAESRMYR